MKKSPCGCDPNYFRGTIEWTVTPIFQRCYATKPENSKPPWQSPLIPLRSSLTLGFFASLQKLKHMKVEKRLRTGKLFGEGIVRRYKKGGEMRWRKRMSQKKDTSVVWRAYNLFSLFS